MLSLGRLEPKVSLTELGRVRASYKLQEYFTKIGHNIDKISSVLIGQDPLSYSDISRYTHLPKRDVKNTCLSMQEAGLVQITNPLYRLTR